MSTASPDVCAAVAAAALAGAVALSARPRPGMLRRSRRLGPAVLCWPLAVPVALLVLHGRALVLAAIAGVVLATLARSWARSRAERRSRERSELALAACEAVAAELDAGRPPGAALARAARDWPDLRPVVAAVRLDADVPEALREVSRLPGAGALAAVAATWQVAHRNGSGLADALRHTVLALRADAATRRVVAAELASARATARLVAGLPAFVLLMGSGLGGDPLGFLLDTVPGLACLALGCAFSLVGLGWLQRIAGRVLR